jgi:hypothetical protein
VLDAVRDGEVVFLLGAGVNMCGRPDGIRWQPRGQYLPNGRELASYLAAKFGVPEAEVSDLARVSQYVVARRGAAKLSKELHELFAVKCAPTRIHKLLASLPGILRNEGSPYPNQFIVTTNYDDVLEEAFREAEEPFDLFIYMAAGEHRGRVWHQPWRGEGVVVDAPNLDIEAGEKRTAIMKIHGAIDRDHPVRDSWVITEEHYIEYLTQTDIATWMPAELCRRLQDSNLECLGYSLKDWNLRAVLHRLRKTRAEGWKWWAVQLDSAEIERYVWMKHDLEILDARLDDYVTAFEESIAAPRRATQMA